METMKNVKQEAMPAGQTISDAEQFRRRLHDMWSGVAGAWGKHAAFIDARGATVTEQMLALTIPRPGERVLELACGPGGVGLAAASHVGATGQVMLSDISVEMLSIAAIRAKQLGLANVSTSILDLEHIAQPDDSFDVVFCREGLMLVQDPGRALREIRRVLRPNGRLAFTVWGPRARNPWLNVIFEAMSVQVGAPMPPPGMPHPFSLDHAGKLADLMASAGLSDVSVSELPTPYQEVSAHEWWERCCSLAGPMARKLASLPEEAREAVRARACDAICQYQTKAGLVIPGVSLLASAGKA
jgi:ubiquinone/menaquinone biosynthesis C-methylase UbiE